MATPKLKAPVGQSPRKGEGDPVRNNPGDVELVRKMLKANGFNVPQNSKVDAGLIKAINHMQKKAGIKNPDGVIDPGKRTVKAMLPKFETALKDEAKGATEEKPIPMKAVKWKGKELLLIEKDYQLVKADIFKQLDRYIKSLISNHKFNLQTYQEYLDTAQLKDGIMSAVAHTMIMTWGGVKYPKQSVVSRSIKATGALERAVMSKSLEQLDTALPEAEKAINAFSAETQRFLKDYIGSGEDVTTGLMVGSAVAFGVVGVMAGPALVAATGMTATKAVLVSGASVSILQSASHELGKHASGQKVTLWGSVKAVAIDGTIGLATAGIGNKIPVKYIQGLCKGLAPRLASKVPYLTVKQLEPFLVKYLAHSGAEVMKASLVEAVNVIGKMAKSGKVPTEKDLDKALDSILFAALSARALKKLGGFQKTWAYKNKEILQGQIVPDRFAKLVKNNKIPNTIKAKMYADVTNKVSEEAMKFGFGKAIEKSDGTPDENKLVDIAAKELASDKRIQKIIDAEIERALKKHKVPAE